LKIEGRMKSPEYVYLVTKAYREQLDKLAAGDHLPANESTVQNLLQIFNRGGSFSTGYYNNYAGCDMMSIVTPKSSGVLVGEVVTYKNGTCKIKFSRAVRPGDGIEIWASNGEHVGTGISKQIDLNSVAELVIKGAVKKGDKVYKSHDKGLIDATKREIATVNRKRKIIGNIDAVAGTNLRLALFDGDIKVEKIGDAVEVAQSAPMSANDILSQLSKTGNTPFEIEFVDVSIDENIFVSKSILNKLRREALQALETAIIQGIKKNELKIYLQPTAFNAHTNQKLSVEISNISHLQTVLNSKVSRVYVNDALENSAALSTAKQEDTEIFIALPTISRNAAEAELKTAFVQLESTAIDGYLVSTYGQLQILQSMNTKKQIVLNYTFNIFNNWAVEFFKSMGIGVTLSQELNISEINAFDTREFELVVYGQQILISTHNCPVGIYDNCRKNANGSNYTLRDRIGVCFPILTDCRNCIAHILNGKMLDTSPKFQSLKNTGAESFRLIFTTEDETTIRETIARYKKALAGATPPHQNHHSTYGHFFRGVE